MNKRTFIHLGLVIILLLAIGLYIYRGTPAPVTNPAAPFKYTNTRYNFSLELPGGWIVFKENFHGAAVVFLDPTEERFDTWKDIGNVMIRPCNPYAPLTALVNEALAENSKGPQFKLISTGNINNEEEWAIYTIMGRTAPDKPLLRTQAYQRFSLHNGNFVTITLSSLPEEFDSSLPVFETICNSFRWNIQQTSALIPDKQ